MDTVHLFTLEFFSLISTDQLFCKHYGSKFFVPMVLFFSSHLPTVYFFLRVLRNNCQNKKMQIYLIMYQRASICSNCKMNLPLPP